MSGICGFLNRRGEPASSRLLQGMMEVIGRRGPEGRDSWISDQAVLGQLLTRITPESIYEQLPLVDNDFGMVLCCDARIDNRTELFERLGMEPAQSTKYPDSLLIAAAYKKWGEDCPAYLIGDYAFVLWNAKEKSLFCARDHFGSRPLYYFLTDKLFAFSSEIKALLTLPDISSELYEPRVADFMQLLFDNNVDTFYQNIYRLEPATTLTVSLNKVQHKSYWHLDPERRLPPATDAEYAEQFREIFTESVRCRLRSRFPVGCMLSGGLDSSSVACVARTILAERGEELHTFSGVYPGLPAPQLAKIDERVYLQTVLDQGGFCSHTFRADRVAPLACLDNHLHLIDQPFYSPNYFLNDETFRLASENGVRVVLDGQDGDTTISHGYERLHWLILQGHWPTFAREMKLLAKRQGRDRRHLFYRYGVYPLLKAPLAYLYGQLANRLNVGRNFNILLRRDFALQCGLQNRIGGYLASFDRPRLSHFYGLTSPLQTAVTEIINPLATDYSLSSRSPFYDRRLVEFCLALPSAQKFQQGWSRFILRQGMEGILPQSVQWRPDKSDLSFGFASTLLRYHQDVLEEVVAHVHPFLRRTLNNEILVQNLNSFKESPFAYQVDHLNLYGVLLLHRWLTLQNHSDNDFCV